jgi:hypothetical protein
VKYSQGMRKMKHESQQRRKRRGIREAEYGYWLPKGGGEGRGSRSRICSAGYQEVEEGRGWGIKTSMTSRHDDC